MPGDEDASDKKKSHHARKSGVSAEKKKLKKTKSVGKDETLTARQRNPKAFAINSAISAERNFRRKEDLTAKKQHIPIVDKTPDVPPPVLVAVVGPPKVGKSTVIRNLIKNFTRTNVTEIKGPITIVTSKKRRITLIECNNDVNSMIDIAKCADLVLLLCDASYGFEMEIFEFLNICQVHGMPKIMGVLTHLDVIRNPKAMRTRKKELKKRFWTEVYDGAKLFYLSGLIHGEYLKNEIQNLGRFISVMKFRPLTWKGTHSHVLVDRVEDVTNTEMIRQNPKCDRDIVLYGYVRGVPMNKELSVHIAGYGDARMEELGSIPDPCPMPGTEKKRNLLEKERMLYAPMSGVGGIVYDKDAVYIELQGSHSHKKRNEEDENAMEQEDLLGKLIEKKQTIDTQIEEQEFRLFSDGAAIKSKDFVDDRKLKADSEDEQEDDESDEEDDEAEDNDSGMDDEEMEDWKVEEDSEEENPAEDSSDEEYQNDESEKVGLDSDFNWRGNLAQKARDDYLERQAESGNLMKLVYGVFSISANKVSFIKYIFFYLVCSFCDSVFGVRKC